jgi:hypothetical protein
MPRPTADKVAADHIRLYLTTNSDFVFEVTVLKSLRQLGLLCRHGGTYEDPVSGKTRQFDIHAEGGRTDRKDIMQFRFAVECKNIGANFPLVVHRLPRDPSESYVDVVLAKESPTLMPFDRSERVRMYGDRSPYAVGELVGKAFDQVGRTSAGDVFGSDQDVFEKMSQAVNSAQPLLEESHTAASSTQRFVFSIVIPVVVVPSGTLWTVDYDDAGTVMKGPEPNKGASTFVGREWSVGGKLGRSFCLSHIEIVTFEALEEFVSSWRDDLRLTSDSVLEFYSASRAGGEG